MYATSVIAASCLLVSNGPAIQNYAVQIIKSDDVNIYETAYKQAITVFPNFQQWLLQALDPAIIIEGIVIGLAALSSSSARTILLRSSVAGFITISLIDTLLVLLYQTDNYLTSISESILSNFVGAPILGLTLLGFMSATHAIINFDGKSHSINKALAIATPALLGLIATALIFFITSTFYRVTPIEFRAMVPAPSNGVYRSDYKQKRSLQGFSLFKSPEVGRTLEWTGNGNDLAIDWQVDSEGRNYSAKVLLLDGCLPEDVSGISLENRSSSLSQSAVTRLSLTADDGLAQMSFPSNRESSGYATASPDRVEQFTIERVDGNQKKHTVFLGPNGSFDHWRPLDPLSFYYSPFLIKGDGDYSAPSQRRFQLTIQERKYQVSVTPNKEMKYRGAMKCQRVPATLTPGTNRFEAKSPIFGILVTLTPQREHATYTVKSRDPLRITKAGGWLWHVSEADDGPEIEGATDFLVVRGHFKSVRASNMSMPLQGEQVLQAFGGESNVTLQKDGQLELSGTVNALYWESSRVNKTRWEKMEATEKGFLLAWVLSLIGLLSRALIRVLSGNKNIRITL